MAVEGLPYQVTKPCTYTSICTQEGKKEIMREKEEERDIKERKREKEREE